MPKQPPHINGVAELTAEEITAMYDKLTVIQGTFVESDDQPVCDTFYLVSTYNKQNVGSEINGDTAQYVLAVGGANGAGA